jgi:hypothetical protein
LKSAAAIAGAISIGGEDGGRDCKMKSLLLIQLNTRYNPQVKFFILEPHTQLIEVSAVTVGKLICKSEEQIDNNSLPLSKLQPDILLHFHKSTYRFIL